MMGWSAGTFGIIPLSCTFLISLTHYDRRIEVKRVIIKDQLRKKTPEQVAEYALVDELRKFVEKALICPMISTTFPTKKLAKCSIITNYIEMAKAVGTTPYTGEQTKNKLYGLIATI